MKSSLYSYNIFSFPCHTYIYSPITLGARSKAWTVFARSNAGVVGSNPTGGMDVCVRLFCVWVLLCVGSGLATGWPLSKESYRLCKKDYETEEEARAQQRAVEPLMNEKIKNTYIHIFDFLPPQFTGLNFIFISNYVLHLVPFGATNQFLHLQFWFKIKKTRDWNVMKWTVACILENLTALLI
jgi:hypothetical protein